MYLINLSLKMFIIEKGDYLSLEKKNVLVSIFKRLFVNQKNNLKMIKSTF